MISTDPASQQVTVGEWRLYCFGRRCLARDVNWVSIAAISAPRRAQVRIRHRHHAAEATLYPVAEGVEVRFDEPQRAVAPGQAAVFYDGDLVLGGGWIA